MKKWPTLVLIVLVGIAYTYLSWREAQKPAPNSDLLPWYIAALLFPLGAWATWAWTRNHRARRRLPPGYCKHCGYNLYGTTSGRCPECGTRIR